MTIETTRHRKKSAMGLRLIVPKRFREHHRTDIVAYSGQFTESRIWWFDDDGPGDVKYNRLSAGSSSDDESIPWVGPSPNRTRGDNDSDDLLLVPAAYPPHTPVMDEVVGNQSPNETGWKEFYTTYRYHLPPEEQPSYSAQGAFDDNHPQFMTMDDITRQFEAKYGDQVPKVKSLERMINDSPDMVDLDTDIKVVV